MLSVDQIMPFIAYFSSSNRFSLRSSIVFSCHISLISFNLEHFHSLSLSFMTNFNKMTVIFSLIFPCGSIQNMHFWLEHYILIMWYTLLRLSHVGAHDIYLFLSHMNFDHPVNCLISSLCSYYFPPYNY